MTSAKRPREELFVVGAGGPVVLSPSEVGYSTLTVGSRQFPRLDALDAPEGDNPPVVKNLGQFRYVFFVGNTIAEPIAKSSPTFAQVWLNLGVYYSAANQNAKAIGAFEKYLALDPTGKNGNLSYVKQQLATLKKAAPSSLITTP